MWQGQQLRRNKADKRHKETENAGITGVTMVLGAVEVAENAVGVVIGLFTVLLTISLSC